MTTQVGAEWGQGGSEQGASVQISLTAPSAQGIPAPYTLTYSGGAPFLSASTWDWNAYISPGGQVPAPVLHQRMTAAASTVCPSCAADPCTAAPPLGQPVGACSCAQLSTGSLHLQVTGSVTSTYMSLLPNDGSTARTGFSVYFSDAAALTPTSVTVNGEVCSMAVTSS